MSVTNTMNAKRVTDEVRHAQEDLEHFYLEAKRNKKLAKWAAKKLGVDKKEYLLELISCDIASAGPKPVVDRISNDFKNVKLGISDEKIWEQLRKCESEVLRIMLDNHAEDIKEKLNSKQAKKKKKKK